MNEIHNDTRFPRPGAARAGRDPWPAGADTQAVATPAGEAVAIAAQRPARTSGVRRVLGWVVGVGALLVVGLAMLAVQSGGSPIGVSTGGSGAGGSLMGDPRTDRDYGYYHDTYFDSGAYAPQWKRDGLRGRRETWDYDGPYAYDGYGSAGMRARASGRTVRDPLYSVDGDLPDVFDEYGSSLDPTGSDPVGDPGLWNLDPNYNPYLGYSNPYENRIRMSFGPGYGQGAYRPAF